MAERSSIDQEGFLKDEQIYFCTFLSYREVTYINMYVLSETNPMRLSKFLMDMNLGWHIWTSANLEEPLYNHEKYDGCMQESGMSSTVRKST